MSLTYSLNIDNTKNLIFYGLMASGKTKNAKLFSSKYPVKHLNTDVVRKQMLNIPLDKNIHVNFNSDIYSPEITHELYKKLAILSSHNSSIGRMTIIDGSFSKKSYIQKFKENNNGKIIKIKFTAPDQIILNRLKKRESKETVSDGRIEIFGKQKESFEDIGADFTIETIDDAEKNILKIMNNLIK
jgi:predicted kinase